MAMACLLIPCAWLLCGRFFPVGGGLWTLPLVTFALVLAHDTESWLAIAGAAALMLLWADLPGPAAYRPDPARMVFGIGSGLALAAFVVARLFRRPASLPATATAPPGR
jgi:hypothetical protein